MDRFSSILLKKIKGTFGQTIPWNLYDPATYQHPSVPLDVLTDPRSLPINQTKKEEETTTDKSSAPVILDLCLDFYFYSNNLGTNNRCTQTRCYR